MTIKYNNRSATDCHGFTSVHSARANTRRSGFTLVELLTVMVIIAILFGMIIGIAMFAKRKATEGRVQADIQHVHNAINEYMMKYGKCPPGPPQSGKTIFTMYDAIQPWLQPNVDEIDSWGREYIYTKDPNNDRLYDFYSQGYDDTIDGDDIRSGS